MARRLTEHCCVLLPSSSSQPAGTCPQRIERMIIINPRTTTIYFDWYLCKFQARDWEKRNSVVDLQSPKTRVKPRNIWWWRRRRTCTIERLLKVVKSGVVLLLLVYPQPRYHWKVWWYTPQLTSPHLISWTEEEIQQTKKTTWYMCWGWDFSGLILYTIYKSSGLLETRCSSAEEIWKLRWLTRTWDCCSRFTWWWPVLQVKSHYLWGHIYRRVTNKSRHGILRSPHRRDVMQCNATQVS